jgi:hypothetical protein
MKFRRFNEAGIAAVRRALPEVEKTGDLAPAMSLLSRDDLTEDIPALADIDLDETRIFDTTFAFCEYFHSLMKDHSPLRYRTDSGFWTWLAVVYLKQLVKVDKSGVDIGKFYRILHSKTYGEAHRHLLSGPYYVFYRHKDAPQICKGLMWNRLHEHGEIQEQIMARQQLVQNAAVVGATTLLYFDEGSQSLKKGSGGSGAGSPRRFATVVDQLALTRDLVEINDAQEFLKLLPKEFDRFNPIKV